MFFFFIYFKFSFDRKQTKWKLQTINWNLMNVFRLMNKMKRKKWKKKNFTSPTIYANSSSSSYHRCCKSNELIVFFSFIRLKQQQTSKKGKNLEWKAEWSKWDCERQCICVYVFILFVCFACKWKWCVWMSAIKMPECCAH